MLAVQCVQSPVERGGLVSAVRAPGFRRSVVNIMSTWGVQGVSVAFALFVVPLVSGRFGVEGLGVWLLVQQLAGHLQLFEMGLNSSLGRYLARALGQNDLERHDGYLSSAVVVLCLLALVVFGLTLAIDFMLPRVFEIPSDLMDQSRWMLLIVGVLTALTLPLRAGFGLLGSRHRFDLVALADGSGLAIKICLVLAVCLSNVEPGLVLLSIAVFLPTVIASLLAFWNGLRCSPRSSVRPGLVSKASVRALLDVSFSALLVTTAAVLLRQGAPMIVGAQLGVEIIPMLAIPLMIVSVIRPFVAVANKLMAPLASQFDAAGAKEQLYASFRMSAHYTLFMALVAWTFVATMGHSALTLWLGHSGFTPAHIDTLHQMLVVVLGGYALSLPGAMGRTLLGSVGLHWQAAWGEIVGTAVGLIVGAVLLFVDGSSPWGMAVGICVAYLVRALTSAVRLLGDYFCMSQRALYGAIWMRPLGVALPGMFLMLLAIRKADHPWLQGALAGAAIFVWILLAWRYLIEVAHADRIRRLFSSRR